MANRKSTGFFTSLQSRVSAGTVTMPNFARVIAPFRIVGAGAKKKKKKRLLPSVLSLKYTSHFQLLGKKSFSTVP